MSESQTLYQEFLKSRLGKVYRKQGIRNFTGRCLHGATRHPIKSTVLGAMILPLAIGNPLFGLPAFAALSGGVLGMAKNEEKTAREFLMNVAIRKSNAFKSFLEGKGISDATKAQAIEYCLKENAPMFGGFKEFQKDMPDAVSQIMNSKNDAELPFYRTQGVLRNEMMQKLFKQRGTDGGIIQGLKNIITGEERTVCQLAEQQLSTPHKTQTSIADAASKVSIKQLMQEYSQTPVHVQPKDNTRTPSVTQQQTTQTNLQTAFNKKIIDSCR